MEIERREKMKPDKSYRLIVFKIIKRKTLKLKTLDWPSKRRLSNYVKGRYNKIQTKQIKHFNEQSVNQIKKPICIINDYRLKPQQSITYLFL